MEQHRTPVRVLQPELVGVMRLFAIFHVLRSLVLAILVLLHGEPAMTVIFLPLATSIGFLVYVYLDFLRAEMGRWYLIVTVTLFTIDTVTTKGTFWLRDVFVENLLRADGSDHLLQVLISGFTSGVALVWNPFFQMSMLISLLMLLIVLSWQYDFRYSLGFTLATSFFDFMLNVLLVTDDAASIALSLTIILGRTFIFILVGRLTTHLVGVQNAQQRSLVQANADLARQAVVVEDLAISRERNRMARELHDTLAHTLSAAAVQIEAATAQQGFDEAKTRAALERAGSTIRGGLNEMRRALKALRASPLDDLGFELALRELCDQTQQRSGAAVKMRIADGLRLWSNEEEHALYRVVQESLENIVRHAEARFVQVELRRDGRVTALDIRDDGVGFDVGAARSDPHRFGVRGIVERVEALGGRVRIESSPGNGTLIAVRMEDQE